MGDPCDRSRRIASLPTDPPALGDDELLRLDVVPPDECRVGVAQNLRILAEHWRALRKALPEGEEG